MGSRGAVRIRVRGLGEDWKDARGWFTRAPMASTSYAIALGSNRPHGGYGRPADVLKGAVAELAARGYEVQGVSRIFATEPLGPAGRSFANAALVLTSNNSPLELLKDLKSIERAFGRRRVRRWGARVLDLDILLWSNGRFRSRRLAIPHPEFRKRLFVLNPLAEVAPTWVDPVSGLSVRQLLFRRRRAVPLS
jgi:2-amino-4-hydroxy-6-hydroxymethyldihydropteridine diphosphokinase